MSTASSGESLSPQVHDGRKNPFSPMRRDLCGSGEQTIIVTHVLKACDPRNQEDTVTGGGEGEGASGRETHGEREERWMKY